SRCGCRWWRSRPCSGRRSARPWLVEHQFDNLWAVALPQSTTDAPRERLREVAGRARPVALARERQLPVLPPLAPLFPDGGLRRGSTVAVAGSTALALALAAGAS